ncbi:MAG: hypothetical protein D6730_15105 [Bacteroidetes bacterium]|nr:MAG: hypothetical protein D6730_15105 [Bacteroidota bacterium]
MPSVKVYLNDKLVFNPDEALLAEKGFMVTVDSRRGIPNDASEKDGQIISLHTVKKDLLEGAPPELEQYLLKVGDKITIVGNV